MKEILFNDNNTRMKKKILMRLLKLSTLKKEIEEKERA